MLDPKEILDAVTDMHAHMRDASDTLAQPFLGSVADLSISSSSNASSLIGKVQEVGSRMLNHMSNIKMSVDNQVAAHQDAQQRREMHDFNVDMSDLRPTTAVGFPQEMPDVFFAPFKTK